MSIVEAEFTCEIGSIPSICPDGDTEFLGCFPERLICNLESNCPGGTDEVNCTDYGELHRIANLATTLAVLRNHLC